MPPQKTKELRSFRIDASLLERMDALCEKRGDAVEIMEEALRRELARRERAIKAIKPPSPDPA